MYIQALMQDWKVQKSLSSQASQNKNRIVSSDLSLLDFRIQQLGYSDSILFLWSIPYTVKRDGNKANSFSYTQSKEKLQIFCCLVCLKQERTLQIQDMGVN